MVKKYEFMKVGTTRHPEIYDVPEILTEPVIKTVEQELSMWKAAEKIYAILKKGKFKMPQIFFIWHYVLALFKLDNLEELEWFEWLKFRLYHSRMRDMDNK